MKKTIYKILLPAFFLAALSLFSLEGKSQNRKSPDGSIVYPDGSRKLPNGTVINKNGTVPRRNNDVVPRKQVIYKDGRSVNERRRYTRRSNGKWMPPGQAKKVYGGSARDYAPGQQKKWKKNKDWKNKNKSERDHDYEKSKAKQGKHSGKNHENKNDSSN
ncbi:MAG: hypothetical protein ABIU11_02925 [Chitinophagaceae bacterium]